MLLIDYFENLGLAIVPLAKLKICKKWRYWAKGTPTVIYWEMDVGKKIQKDA